MISLWYNNVNTTNGMDAGATLPHRGHLLLNHASSGSIVLSKSNTRTWDPCLGHTARWDDPHWSIWSLFTFRPSLNRCCCCHISINKMLIISDWTITHIQIKRDEVFSKTNPRNQSPHNKKSPQCCCGTRRNTGNSKTIRKMLKRYKHRRRSSVNFDNLYFTTQW